MIRTMRILIAGLGLAFVATGAAEGPRRGVYEQTGPGTGRCVIAPAPDGGDDEIHYATAVWAPAHAPQGCTITLMPGRYTVRRPIRLRGRVTLQAADDNPRTRAATILERAVSPPYTGPLVEVGYKVEDPDAANTPRADLPPPSEGAKLLGVTLDGRRDAVQAKGAINVYIARCVGATVAGTISRNSPGFTSIQVYSGIDLTIAGNRVEGNQGDGMSVAAVEGASQITGNEFVDNEDIHLIVAGGSLGRLTIARNVILPSSRHAGATFALDTEPGWSSGFSGNKRDSRGRPIDFGDFAAVTFEGNVDRCGPASQYGMAIGTHMNANWGKGLDGPPPPGPPAAPGSPPRPKVAPPSVRNWAVRNLRIPNTAGNDLDRVTIDYLGSGSQVDLSSGPRRQFRTSCTYNASPEIATNSDPQAAGKPYHIPGTLNTSGCIPCGSRGSDYGYAAPAPVCDWNHDR